MLLKWLLLFFVSVFINVNAESLFKDKTELNGVKADTYTFREIYENNLKQSQYNILSIRNKTDMSISYSLNQPIQSSFSNEYYEIPFSDQVTSNSTFGFYGSQVFYLRHAYSISWISGFSYTYSENILFAKSKSGGTYKDVLKYQSIPLLIGTKFSYQFQSDFISELFVKFGIVYEWVSMVGSLDGINQNYWNPGYQWSIGSTFFRSQNHSTTTEFSSSEMNNWFGGVYLSAGMIRPLSENRKGSQSQLIDLGLVFLL